MNNEQKAENIFVARHIAKALMLYKKAFREE
jgi:hypothetical protein